MRRDDERSPREFETRRLTQTVDHTRQWRVSLQQLDTRPCGVFVCDDDDGKHGGHTRARRALRQRRHRRGAKTSISMRANGTRDHLPSAENTNAQTRDDLIWRRRCQSPAELVGRASASIVRPSAFDGDGEPRRRRAQVSPSIPTKCSRRRPTGHLDHRDHRPTTDGAPSLFRVVSHVTANLGAPATADRRRLTSPRRRTREDNRRRCATRLSSCRHRRRRRH